MKELIYLSYFAFHGWLTNALFEEEREPHHTRFSFIFCRNQQHHNIAKTIFWKKEPVCKRKKKAADA
ncbi:hypothetical protein [Sporosarcina sp. NPDC096371]|uniref:hypothetical protein n=1 Tax=Sporosarcina sp. NPDC096371 TaxID=3364530 RepID=UPI0037F77509